MTVRPSRGCPGAGCAILALVSDPDVIQYPRAVVSLSADLVAEDEPLDAVVIPRKVVVTRRPHTQADTCEVQLDGVDLPFDPRTLRDIVLTVHMADVRNAGAGTMPDNWRSARTLRFIGHVDTFDNEQEEEDVLTLRARDLSSILRDAKPLPTDAVPRYSDTLGQAINRILEAVPGANILAVQPSGDENTPLSAAVGGRVRNGPVHVENNWSAWEVIEHTCGLVARLVSVVNDFIVLRQARQAYANAATPAVTLSFNTTTANLTALHVEKKFQRNRKGIRVVSYDPVTRTTLEADWPSDATLRELNPTRRARRPRTSGAGSHGGGSRRAPAPPKPPDRDVFPAPGVTSREELTNIARQVWEERSRQELNVKCDTPYFTEAFLNLRNGDRVRVELNRALAAGLNLQQPEAQQVAFVQRRLQVSRRAAELLVRAAQHPGTDMFYVHEAQLVWAGEGDGGDTGVKLSLINLIPVETR